MKRMSQAVVFLVALAHIGFLVLEMFLWEHEIGMKVFKRTAEEAASSAVLAANQGLYNGLLAAGLLFGLFHRRKEIGEAFQQFFLFCVLVAGLYGAYSAKFSILFVQATPALIGLILLHLSKEKSNNTLS